MKKVLLFSLLTTVISCNSKKNVVENNIDAKKKEIITKVVSKCPEDGKCSVEIFKNKTLNIKRDEFDKIYFDMLPSSATSVIQYKYNRNPPNKTLKDGNYTEEIIFEIQNSVAKLNLSDNDLQKTKMLFGRLCFCKGQTGHYSVNQGKLVLDNINDLIKFNLEFKITEVPQIVNSISETIQ
jgi:hypothetical protein